MVAGADREQLAADDRFTGITKAGVLIDPDAPGSVRGPVLQQAFFVRDVVAAWAAPLRPVGGEKGGGKPGKACGDQEGEWKQRAIAHSRIDVLDVSLAELFIGFAICL